MYVAEVYLKKIKKNTNYSHFSLTLNRWEQNGMPCLTPLHFGHKWLKTKRENFSSILPSKIAGQNNYYERVFKLHEPFKQENL